MKIARLFGHIYPGTTVEQITSDTSVAFKDKEVLVFVPSTNNINCCEADRILDKFEQFINNNVTNKIMVNILNRYDLLPDSSINKEIGRTTKMKLISLN